MDRINDLCDKNMINRFRQNHVRNFLTESHSDKNLITIHYHYYSMEAANRDGGESVSLLVK